METYPTLYKRTSAGKVQIWRLERDGASYRTVSGQIDGQHVESGWKAAKPKNVGKSNETTAEEQAHLECEAQYKKKLAQGGYHDNLDSIDEAKFFKPMLAKKYEGWPGGEVYAQPKLDGVRCIANREGLWTRQGKPIEAVPHIFEALQPFFVEHPDAVLDGELYNHDLRDDFNEIISLVRKQKPSDEHKAKTAEVVEYHVYDWVDLDEGFGVRYGRLMRGEIGLNALTGDSVVLVGTAWVHGVEALDEFYSEWIEQGYEGQMVRLDRPYEQKRSKSLLKRKEFKDEEFEVVAVNEGVGNRSGMAGFITYRLPDGREFGSGIKGSHDYCKQLLADADKYVGGTGTVRFFDYTPDGIPRFPVTVALYEGERDV